MISFLTVLPLVLSAILLGVNLLAQPNVDLRPKVFVIGLSKTGTTSIGNALALLGYKRIGWKDIRSRHLVHTYINGNVQPLIEQTEYFDAFEDLPWPFVYEQMADLYPDAKFLLSLRKDEQTWLQSMKRHQSRGVWEPAVRFYGTQDIDGKGEVVLDAYRSHTANVRRFFRNKPGRYAELVVDNDSDTNWRALCSVAQCPEGGIPSVEFPKSNTIAHWREQSFVGRLHSLWGWSICRVEEICVDLYYGRRWPWLRFMLEQTWRLISVVELACCDLYFTIAVQRHTPLPSK